jgi:hypothetical protein
MDRLYKLYGINTAIDLLRPDAMWTDDQLTRLGMNIPHMFANLLMKLTTDEISLLNSLSSNQIPALSTDQVAALSTSQI